MRKMLAARLRRRVKGGRFSGETLDVESNVVAREQSAVAVKGSVLDGLRGYGCTQLLETMYAFVRRTVEPALEKVNRPSIRRQAAPSRSIDCRVDVRSFVWR
jgi:hypothetical protein